MINRIAATTSRMMPDKHHCLRSAPAYIILIKPCRTHHHNYQVISFTDHLVIEFFGNLLLLTEYHLSE